MLVTHANTLTLMGFGQTSLSGVRGFMPPQLKTKQKTLPTVEVLSKLRCLLTLVIRKLVP